MIGGNIAAELQRKSVSKNEIGEHIVRWETVQAITGWIDLTSGDSKYNVYNAKIQESTHMFLCDYVPVTVTAENSRLIVGGKSYDVMLIDDPMELHQHLEFYLKYTGGQ